MTSFDPRISDALGREVPLRAELEPAWKDVLARATGGRAARRRWKRFLVAAVVTAVLAGAGVAIAGAVDSGPLHGGRLDVNATTLASGVSTCDLIGQPASQVQATLASSGIGVEWRYTHWGTTVVTASPAAAVQSYAHAAAQAEAVTGGSSDAVSSVPDDSVVWDIVPDGATKAFVFVEAPNDPNAPTVSTDNCSG